MSGSDAELTLIMKAKNLAGREVDKLHGALLKLKGGVKDAGGVLAGFVKGGIIGFAGLAAGALGVGPGMLDLAAKLELMNKKATTVFGDQIGKVKTWADANATAMGLTSTQATGLAANFADLLIPMKFTREQAADMSTKVVGLSGALAQWSGGTQTAAQVSDTLSKAMLGERDGLKGLGISISDADVQARLLKNGTNKLTGAQLEQAKATATMQLIFEKSTDAQAAYAKGGDSLAAKQAVLHAKIAALGEQIATRLGPIFLRVASFVLDNVVPAVAAAIGKIEKWFSENKPLISQITGFVSKTLGALVTKLGDVVTWVGSVVSTMWGNGNGPLAIALRGAAGLFGVVLDAVGWVVGRIADLIGGIQSAIEWLGKLGQGIERGGQGISSYLEQTGGAIPGNAAGGWVGLHGPELSWVGERGPEYIVPNHDLGRGGSGASLNYELVAVGKRDLARMVDEQLYFMLRRAAPTSGRT